MCCRKRAAAKQLIERYYCQLTEGCGLRGCSNSNCASSESFQYKQITANQAAIHAIQLFTSKATLCDPLAPVVPPKVAKNNQSHEDGKANEGVSEASGSQTKDVEEACAKPSTSGVSSVSSHEHPSTSSSSSFPAASSSVVGAALAELGNLSNLGAKTKLSPTAGCLTVSYTCLTPYRFIHSLFMLFNACSLLCFLVHTWNTCTFVYLLPTPPTPSAIYAHLLA